MGIEVLTTETIEIRRDILGQTGMEDTTIPPTETMEIGRDHLLQTGMEDTIENGGDILAQTDTRAMILMATGPHIVIMRTPTVRKAIMG